MDINQAIRFEGCNYFRERLVLACFSGRKIVIRNIRVNEDVPGLKDFEHKFLELLQKITNGSIFKIKDTGISIIFTPGSLTGTETHIKFVCPNSRGIGYYLEPLFMIAPFCKYKMDITLKGVTNNDVDLSFDMIKYSLYPILEKFLVTDDGLSLKLINRGLPPNYCNGSVRFQCPVRKSLKAFQWTEMGKVKKIRGTVYTKNAAPTNGHRMMESAKHIFKNQLADVYFTMDSSNTHSASPGYGLCIVAETNKGCVYSAEVIHSQENINCKNGENRVAEDLGKNCALSLFEEINNAGVTDTITQTLLLLFMILGPKDVSKAVFGHLSHNSIQFMKLLNKFMGVRFKIDEYKDEWEENLKLGSPKLLLSCLGIGYTNVNRTQI